MRRILLAAALVFFIGVSQAAVVTYTTTFSASVGPSGTGSFDWDPDNRLVKNFVWDFGGVTGGVEDGYFAEPYPGYSTETMGSFWFEILTDINVHSFACNTDLCSGTAGSEWVTGYLPNLANRLRITSIVGEFGTGAMYEFLGGTDKAPTYEASGRITVPVVPEPDTLALLGLGLAGLGLSRRRKAN